MLFVVAILLALLVALMRGGRFEQLGSLSFRFGPLILLGFLIQIFLFTPLLGPRLTDFQTAVVYNLSMLLLWGTLLANWRIPGVPLMATGVFLNWLVITLNGGFMPASAAALEQAGLLEEVTANQGRHNNSILLDASTHLPWLADVMAIPAAIPL
ncbi:MAG: DUF5317 family protein, partial [Ardenticatenaceae bacterium]